MAADDDEFDSYYSTTSSSKPSKMERSSDRKTRHDYEGRYSREESRKRDDKGYRTSRTGVDRHERPERHRSSKDIDERVRRASAAINERVDRESARDKPEREHVRLESLDTTPERSRPDHSRHSRHRPTSRSVERRQPQDEPVNPSRDRRPSSATLHSESRASAASEHDDSLHRPASSRHHGDSHKRTKDRSRHDSRHDSSSSSESDDDGSSRHKKRKHRDRDRSGSRERDRKKRKKKDKESRRKDKDAEERRSVLTGKKIKLKVKKDKGDHERDANREKLLKFLNSAYE